MYVCKMKKFDAHVIMIWKKEEKKKKKQYHNLPKQMMYVL